MDVEQMDNEQDDLDYYLDLAYGDFELMEESVVSHYPAEHQHETSTYVAGQCLVCSKLTDEKVSTISSEIALNRLKEACMIRENWQVLKNIDDTPSGSHCVHPSCRKMFTDSRQIKKIKMQQEKQAGLSRKVLRSASQSFNWTECCYLCGKELGELPGVRKVMDINMHRGVKVQCHLRGDEWGSAVLGRLNMCIDLVAADAMYHFNCLSKFRRGMQKSPQKAKRGRPPSDIGQRAFEMACEKLEADCEMSFYTLEDLKEIMWRCGVEISSDTNSCEVGGSNEPSWLYSTKSLQRLLLERYGDHVYIAHVKGRRNVVCFKEFGHHLISDKWKESQMLDNSGAAEKVVKLAARLIAAELREMEADVNFYPDLSSMTLESCKSVVPTLLNLFMSLLVKGELKQVALAQAVIQAAQPRTNILPLQVGLGIMVDHMFGSEQLLHILSRLGFSVSADEVVRFKQSVMQLDDERRSFQADLPIFTQFIADNVDHNINTLDGKGTFHGMGMISASTGLHGSFSHHRIARMHSRLKASEACTGRSVKIVPYHLDSGAGLNRIVFQGMELLRYSNFVLPNVTKYNTIWLAGSILTPFNSPDPPPNWSGFMTAASSGPHPLPSQIGMLPILDLSPSYEACIYSTLMFIISQAKQLNCLTPCITFDQPLYIKAIDISTAMGLEIVCRLGPFHTLMSFLGSIGHLMKGSGLEDALSLIFGPNTVGQILSGKNYARTFRAHVLIYGALHHILFKIMCREEDSECSLCPADIDIDCCDIDITELKDVFNKVLQGEASVDDSQLLDCDSAIAFSRLLDDLKKQLSQKSRTSRLWLLYMHYVELAMQFLMAERSSEWKLHLFTLNEMLPLFAASGHLHYAKSSRVYLQQMQQLPTASPWLSDQFQHGHHTIRYTDKFWAGLSSDLVIEQRLMKPIKGRGGLTRGKGLTETVRTVWLECLTECADITAAMSQLIKLRSSQVDLHVEVGSSRRQRDWSDMSKLVSFFCENSPFHFEDDCNLISLSLGVVAGPQDKVNCDDAESIGWNMQRQWDGIAFPLSKLRKADCIKNLSDMLNVCKVGTDNISLDPNILFNRLILMAERSGDIKDCFSFELTSSPMSLFKNGFMRKPDKPSLYREFVSDMQNEQLPAESKYVVDGGYLLHKIRWTKGSTFTDIMNAYVGFVRSKFNPSSVVIVFDGYSTEPSTKDHEHKRRLTKVSKVAPEVRVNPNGSLNFDQDAFLANPSNKRHFIDSLIDFMSCAGISTKQACADADTEIVSCAVMLAAQRTAPVVVYAEDTDIFAMLVFHLSLDMSDIYFFSDGKKRQRSTGKCINIRKVKQRLGTERCSSILVLHAFGGCDTTSAIFGHGKGSIFDKLAGNSAVHHCISDIQNPNASSADVGHAGQQLMVSLYGGKPGVDTLTKLRFTTYCKLLMGRHFNVERLPPTDSAASMHSLRVHLQVLEWEALGALKLEPTRWGWKSENGSFTPVQTDKVVAPEELLKFVRCQCQQDCSSMKCSCRRNGLRCVAACSHCLGADNCTNAAEDEKDVSSIDSDSEPSSVYMVDDQFNYGDEEIVE